MKITKLPSTKGLCGSDKIGSTFPSNVVLFTNSVIDTILVGCKCPFRHQIRLELSLPLPHGLKYFLFRPQIRCFRDIKFNLTNKNYILLLINNNFIINQQHATFTSNS